MSLQFRTEYFPDKSSLTLDPSKPLVFIGSCFSENISARFRQALWEAPNPCGTLFNPSSIKEVLRLILFSTDPTKEFLNSLRIDSRGIVHSMLFSSILSSHSEEETISRFNSMARLFRESIGKASALVITFGTSWIYEMKNGKIAGNCHKFPAYDFTRRRLTPEEIVRDWSELIAQMQQTFPSLSLIFTVSPVRHLKDGFTGNAISKATLLLALEQLCSSNPECYYFPAYEILNDDLRDYRFYASDLVHPSEQGVEYIFEKFVDTFIDDNGKAALRRGEKEYRQNLHRSLISK